MQMISTLTKSSLVALMDDADGVRHSDRVVFPLTRRPRCWWGRGEVSPSASRPDWPLSLDRRRFLTRQQVMTSRVKARRRRCRQLPTSGLAAHDEPEIDVDFRWRLDDIFRSRLTWPGHVSHPSSIYSDLATMSIRDDSEVVRCGLYNIHALGLINHCASPPEKMSV